MVESCEQEEWPEWTILGDYLHEKPYSYEHSYAVHHSFGRGRFREVAAKVVVPKIVLDQIIGEKCWTERPRGPVQVGGGGAGSASMGGVNTPLKPKRSGRARALHMRSQNAALEKRRPGREAWKVAEAMEDVSSIDSGHTSGHTPSAGSGYYSLNGSSPTCEDDTPSPPSSLLAFSPYPKNSSHLSPATPISKNNIPHFKNDDLDVSISVPEFDSASVSGSTPSRMQGGGDVVTVTAAGKEEGIQDWLRDANTLYFSNIPATTTAETLVQCIKPFGTLTNAMVVPVDKRSQGEGEEEEGEGGGDDYTIAYVRMENRSACEWVISCYHGNSFENSTLPVLCGYAKEQP